MLGKVSRSTLSEVDQASLGSTVRWIGLRSDLPGNGTHKQDRSAAGIDQRFDKGMHHPYRANQVDIEYPGPVSWIELPKGKSVFP